MSQALRSLLRERVAHEGNVNVVRAMGYRSGSFVQAERRLCALLEHPHLGLGSGWHDFRFSNHEFLQSLAKTLRLDEKFTQEAVRDIEARLAAARKAFKPWMFVETNFQRRDEPVFVLAVLESKRRLRLPAESYQLEWNELIRVAGDLARAHHASTRGELLIWGKISAYKVIVAENEEVMLDVCGSVISTGPLSLGGEARLTLR